MVHLGSIGAWLLDEGVESSESLVDGGFFECTIEDIDRLVLTGHDTFLWSMSPGPGVGSGEDDCERRNSSGGKDLGKGRLRCVTMRCEVRGTA